MRFPEWFVLCQEKEAMYFKQNFVTRWHDTDANRFLRPSAILTYLEETSGIHMRHVGRSLDDVRDKDGLAFILSKIGMNFYAPISPFRNICVETWVNEGKGYSSVRHFRLYDEDKLVVEASTVWALIDLSKRFPIKLDAFDFGFSFEEEKLDVSTRFHIPKDFTMENVGVRRIAYSDIDYNMHMNNTHYPDMLCDFLPDMQNERVSSMTLSFLREAPFEQTLLVFRGKTDEGIWFMKTKNDAGETCLEAEIKTAPLT